MLASKRHRVAVDSSAFTRDATSRGWGDGLPLVLPTEELVQAFVDSSGRDPASVICTLPPLGAECTVELVAVNAAMAGAPAESMRLLIATIEAMSAPDFELHALNATTAPVVPATFVNGQIRHELGIAFGAGCLGGADGNSASIGRAIRLIMRNVAGQRVGVTSQTVFGQPGRTSGIVFGEWEERSPWAPLAERRGTPGDAVTVFGTMGTMNVLDTTADSADLLLSAIGRSLAYPGANGYFPGFVLSEMFVAINPVWAEIIGRTYPDIGDVESRIWEAAALPIESWPAEYRPALEAADRVDSGGRVHILNQRTGRLLIAVCGGLGGLHAAALHGFGTSISVTRAIA